jgi:OOP family OmpA-OmpF porin
MSKSKTVITVAAAVAAFASATPALAGNFYVLGGLGWVLTERNVGKTSNSDDDDSVYDDSVKSHASTGAGYKLGGGYQFNPYFAIEAAYVDLGNSKSKYEYSVANPLGSYHEWQQDSFKTSGLNFSAVVNAPIRDTFNVFLKIGLLSGKMEDSWINNVDGVTTSGTATRRQTGFSLGFGGSWNFTKELSLRGEFEFFDLHSPSGSDNGYYNTHSVSASLISVGLGYKF